MSNNNRNSKKKRLAVVLAVAVALSMILSLISPFLGLVNAQAQVLGSSVLTQENSLNETSAPEPNEITDGRFTIEANIGFNDNYILEHTTPFSFIVTNNGNEFNGDLEIRINTAEDSYYDYSYNAATSTSKSIYSYITYFEPLELSKNASKKIEFEIPINLYNNHFTVVLKDENSTLHLENFPITPNDPSSLWTGVLSSNPEELVYLNEITEMRNSESLDYYDSTFYKNIYLTAESFPNSLSTLYNFKSLIINDFDTTTLSEEQTTALYQWVNYGGLLIVGTGASAEKVLSGINEENWFEYSSKTTSALLNDNSLLISDANTINGNSILNDSVNSLSEYMVVGEGGIILHNFDLGKNPIPKIDDIEYLLRDIHEIVSPENFLVDSNAFLDLENINYATLDAASKFEPQNTITVSIIQIILAIYILITGPLLYFVLKRKDIREKGWIIIPIFSIGASLLIYLLGFGSYYRHDILKTASIVKIDSTFQNAYADFALGIQSGNKGDLTFTSEDNFKITPVSDDYFWGEASDKELARISISDTPQITFFNNQSWEYNDITTNKAINLGGELIHNLTFDGNSITGTITNETKYDFEDVVINCNLYLYKVDTLNQGETIEVNITASDLSTAISQDRYAIEELFEINDHYNDLFPEQDLYDAYSKTQFLYTYMRYFSSNSSNEYVNSLFNVNVFAFNKDHLIEGNKYLNNKVMSEQSLNLFSATLPTTFVLESSFDIPFGTIQPTAIYGEKIGNLYEPNENIAYVYDDDMIYSSFNIPSEINLEEFSIKWEVAYGTIDSVEILNASTGEWELLKESYSNPSTFIQNDNRIIVRVFANENSELFYPEISIYGGL